MKLENCCKVMFRRFGPLLWKAGPADTFTCRGCRRRWAWWEGAWYPGPIVVEEKPHESHI